MRRIFVVAAVLLGLGLLARSLTRVEPQPRPSARSSPSTGDGRAGEAPALQNRNDAGDRSPDSPLRGNSAEARSADPVDPAVERANDPTVPLAQRKAEIEAIVRRGNAAAQQTLRRIASCQTYLNWYAVQQMGSLAAPDASTMSFLSGRLADQDARLACESARAYAILAGEKGVRELGDALAANRARADGLSYSVRGALVTALTPLDPRPAVPALLDDLAQAGQKGWNLDYGSKVVRALNAAGTPEALAGIAVYADLLAEKRPSDPLAKRSFDTKIDEARVASTRPSARR